MTDPKSAASVEPVAYLYQHNETGMTGIVLAENRWSNMPRYLEVALYTAPPAAAERIAQLEAQVKMLQANDMATVHLRRRVEKLEGLLRDVVTEVTGPLECDITDGLYERIRAALGE